MMNGPKHMRQDWNRLGETNDVLIIVVNQGATKDIADLVRFTH